jgi:hypothetical protein
MGTIENDPKTLFSLQISQNKFSGQITQQDNTFTLYDYYKVNLDPGLRRDPGNTTSYIHEWFSSRRKLCLDARIREHDVNGACLHRKIIYHKEEKKILIQDWYLQNNNLKTPVNLNWAFNLAPQIKVLEDKNLWKLFSQDTPLCILHSTLPLKLTTGLFSPNYSEKQSCAKLTAQITQDFNIHQTVITIL